MNKPRSRIQKVEIAVMQLQTEMKWVKRLGYYIAVILTANLGVNVF